MRSVSARACGAALLLLLVLSSTVPAFAGRIHFPPGSPAEEESAEGRIHSPPGLVAEEESPSAWELFLVWLQWRIMPPAG